MRTKRQRIFKSSLAACHPIAKRERTGDGVVGRWHRNILAANGNYRKTRRCGLIGIVWNDTFAVFGAENE